MFSMSYIYMYIYIYTHMMWFLKCGFIIIISICEPHIQIKRITYYVYIYTHTYRLSIIALPRMRNSAPWMLTLQRTGRNCWRAPAAAIGLKQLRAINTAGQWQRGMIRDKNYREVWDKQVRMNWHESIACTKEGKWCPYLPGGHLRPNGQSIQDLVAAHAGG